MHQKTTGLAGHWEAVFNDSITHPNQYLTFSHEEKRLQLTLDEPSEDWYDIPAEKLYFKDDSLYFERFWGVEKYSATFSPADSTFYGVKEVANHQPTSFTIKKATPNKLKFKIPLTNQYGKPVNKYQYTKPTYPDGKVTCASLEDAGMDPTLLIKLTNQILSGEIPNIHSLLVMKDNKLVLEEYFYGYTADKTHRVHSVTKSITSALVGITIGQGFIKDVHEPAWHYFSERENTKWVDERYPIQLQHLLNMSAGLDWKGLTLNEPNDDMDMYKTADYIGYLLNKSLKYTPGSHFCYNNGLSLMLGQAIEKSSGLPVDAFAQQYLFNKIGAAHYSWDIEANGITRTDGGLKLRPIDMLKFGNLFLNDGKWNNEQVIPTGWVYASTSPKINLGNLAYGYHWWVKDYTIGQTIFNTFYALGHGEQSIMVVPSHNLVFVMTAGNYLQHEQKPFEIIENYILPSLT